MSVTGFVCPVLAWLSWILRILVYQSCHVGYTTVVIPRSGTLGLQVWLWVPHVCPGNVVWGEHQLMIRVINTLLGEVETEIFSSGIKSFKFQVGERRFIGGVVFSSDNCKCFLLDCFNLATLVFCQAAVEDWCCKF